MAETKRQPDPDIVYTGSQITLPEDPQRMPLQDAISTLQRKLEDENTVLDVHEVIEHHPHDALVALSHAMKETYGWASPTPRMTFFGPVAPDLVTVKTGPKADQYLQLPCGNFKLPNVENEISVHLDFRGNQLHITGEVKKGDKHVVVNLANKAREYLKTNSIFRGQAVHLPCNSNGQPQFEALGFIDTDYIKPEELVLNDDEMENVESLLWTPIRDTEICRQHGVPLKRGVLLEGIYGTGKTMTANVTSKVCVQSGWTYILLDDVRGLKEALLFAKRYEPCVIFAEDIDQAVEERDERGNNILNTLDGILTKDSQIITVLTSNYAEKLDRAMLRPGRLDAVISMRPPEEKAVKQLIRNYGRDLVDPNDTLDRAATELAGNIPATIREVVERSKLHMIKNGHEHVTDDDLFNAAVGMTAHLRLLNSEKEAISAEEQVGRSLRTLLNPNQEDMEGIRRSIEDDAQMVASAAHAVADEASGLSGAVRNNTKAAGRLAERVSSVKNDTTEIKKAVTR